MHFLCIHDTVFYQINANISSTKFYMILGKAFKGTINSTILFINLRNIQKLERWIPHKLMKRNTGQNFSHFWRQLLMMKLGLFQETKAKKNDFQILDNQHLCLKRIYQRKMVISLCLIGFKDNSFFKFPSVCNKLQ